MVPVVRRVATYCTAVALVACAGSPIESPAGSDPGSTTDDPSAPSTTIAVESSGEPTDASSSGATTGPSTMSTTDDTTPGTTTTHATTDADTDGTDGSSSGGTTGDVGSCGVVLDEVLHDVVGNDPGFEWVELYNPCDHAIDLAGFSLAWGGMGYVSALDLVGSIPAGGCFVVGGPNSDALNANPSFDQEAMLSLENNTNAAADAVALFDVPAGEVDGAIPIDALIYGEMNENGIIDETGAVGDVDVPPADPGHAFARVDPAEAPGPGLWTITAQPSPGICPNPA